MRKQEYKKCERKRMNEKARIEKSEMQMSEKLSRPKKSDNLNNSFFHFLHLKIFIFLQQ